MQIFVPRARSWSPKPRKNRGFMTSPRCRRPRNTVKSNVFEHCHRKLQGLQLTRSPVKSALSAGCAGSLSFGCSTKARQPSRLKHEKTKLETDLNAVSNSSVARPWKLTKQHLENVEKSTRAKMSLPEYSLRGALHRSSDNTFLKQALRAPKAIKACLGDKTERLAKSERPTRSSL